MTTPFDNMSPEKAQFIKQIVSEASGKSPREYDYKFGEYLKLPTK